MKRGHFIFVYFIIYVAVVVAISIKLLTFEIARNELVRVDMAIATAGNKAAEVLDNHVYEEDVEQLLRETFIYVYSCCMNETDEVDIQTNRDIIDRLYIGINGEISGADLLMAATDSDELTVFIVLKDITIHTPFRNFVISREYFKEVSR